MKSEVATINCTLCGAQIKIYSESDARRLIRSILSELISEDYIEANCPNCEEKE